MAVCHRLKRRNEMKKVIITTIWIIIPLTASAIFFDDFDGDDFSSNWKPYYG